MIPSMEPLHISEGDLARDIRSILQRVESGAEVIIERDAQRIVTVLELAHGITRADTPERRQKRQRFLDELLSGVPVQPVTVPIALRAGQIDGHSQSKGVRIPLSDLLIGASAVELDYAVGTANIATFD